MNPPRHRLSGHPDMQPRYDEERGIYRDCRWCQGTGCVSCKIEADKAYKAAFPDGPKPIATFPATESGLEQLRRLIGGKAIQDAQQLAETRAAETLETHSILQGVLADHGLTHEQAVRGIASQNLPGIIASRIHDTAEQINKQDEASDES